MYGVDVKIVVSSNMYKYKTVPRMAEDRSIEHQRMSNVVPFITLNGKATKILRIYDREKDPLKDAYYI